MRKALLELTGGFIVMGLSLPMMQGGDTIPAIIVLAIGALICFDSLFRMARS